MNFKTNTRDIFFYSCITFLYFMPLVVFIFPVLPLKLASLGYLLFMLTLSFKFVKRKSSLYALIILAVYLFAVSFFYQGVNYFILAAGILAYITGFLTIILFRDNPLEQNTTKKYFISLLILGLIQLPVNLILLGVLAGYATPDGTLFIVDIGSGTFGLRKTGQLGIFCMLMIFILLTGVQKFNKKFPYWITIVILLTVLVITHSGGAVILLIGSLGIWVLMNFNKTQIAKSFTAVGLLFIISVGTFKAMEAVLPEDSKYLLKDFDNIFLYSMLHLKDNTYVVTIEGYENPNKFDAVKKVYGFIQREGNVITGTQAGIMRNYFYSWIQTVEDAYLKDKAFPGNYIYYTSGYSVYLGETGLLGIAVLTMVFIFLCAGSFRNSSVQVMKIKAVLIIIFLVYNLYRFSFLDYQFIFLWAFLYFNAGFFLEKDRGDGEMGRWEDGEMGRWEDRKIGR